MTMTGLFDPARHEPLQAAPWDEGAARAAITRIVESALAEFRPGEGWLTHPLDDPDGPGHVDRPLYHGAAGVVLALRHLARSGAIAPDGAWPDVGPLLMRLREVNHAGLAGHRHGSASFLIGDVGMDLLLWTLLPDEAIAQRLHEAIAGNLHNPVREALWGNSGTVLAAIFLAETTGEARWGDLVRRAADALEAEMALDPDTGTWVWVQDLYGRPAERLLGAGHGFAGNVYPFLRGAALLPAEQVARVTERALATLQATALRADGGANWLPAIDPGRADPKRLVQDCHGAPGIVCRLATAPRTAAWDTLLAEAGELTWVAGPLSKGPSLCHGTIGSALALHKLWQRTGNALWRERARALAMHAAGQVERARVQHGQGRHSLWTGDLGVACVLQACRAEEADAAFGFPSLDRF
jgi:hypothetical protein